MANHVITEIRNAIKYGLGTIIVGGTPGNGYTYKRTINHIAKPIEDPEQFPTLDAAVVYMDDDECANSTPGSHTQSGANQAILENHIDATIINFMQDANDIELAQDDKLADLQAYFGAKYYIPGDGIDRTVFNTIYLRSKKFGYSATRPNCGIAVTFRIWYRQKLEDPTSLA